MKRAISVLLLVFSACSSGPDEEALTLDLFHRLELDFHRYNGALDRGDRVEQARIAFEVRQLVDANFDLVLAGLESGDAVLQPYAVFALGFSKNPDAIAALAAATSSSQEGVRANAIAALGLMGGADVPLEPFQACLDDDSSPVRHAALFGLRHLLRKGEDRGLLGKIHEGLGDDSQDVQNEALIVLRKIGSAESIAPILEGPLRSESTLLKSNAAVTLGALGPAARQANPYLIEMLLDTEPKVVKSAWTALNTINEKDFDRSYATWRDWYDDEQRHYFSCSLHRDVEEPAPGACRYCKAPLERFAKDAYKKSAPLAVVFGCPDHPQVVTSTPSTCGKEGCGKPLVQRKPDAVVYVCPDHPEVETTTPAKCGKAGCGKDLSPKK